MSQYNSGQSQPDVIQYIKELEKRIEILEKTNPLNNGTTDKGGITIKSEFDNSQMYLGRGRIALWDDFLTNPDGYGLIYCDPVGGSNLFRFFPPYSDGNGLQNSITIQGDAPGVPGNVWIYTQGNFSVLDADNAYIMTDSNIYLSTQGDMDLFADIISLNGLPSASAPQYQLGYDNGTGQWSIVLDTSSRRYKTDIVDAEIDFGKLLDLKPVYFKNINDIEEVGAMAPLRFGLIAEDVDDLGLGLPLVTYNNEAQPDAIKYSLVAVMLIPVVRDLKNQVEYLTQEVADLRSRVEELEAK